MSTVATIPMSRQGVPIWRWGIWWFLASEIVTFGGLIVSYVLFRLRHPEWGLEAAHTLNMVGAVNTVVLLTSSLTMILAHHEVEHKNHAQAGFYLLVTTVLGFVFIGFKIFEYAHEISHGLLPAKSLFWSYYYLMTGLHLLHLVGGLVANITVWSGVRDGTHAHRIESVGLYWHFVDVVWIFLFPLLYIASAGTG